MVAHNGEIQYAARQRQLDGARSGLGASELYGKDIAPVADH